MADLDKVKANIYFSDRNISIITTRTAVEELQEHWINDFANYLSIEGRLNDIDSNKISIMLCSNEIKGIEIIDANKDF